jgi:hypothetical protein
MCYTLSIQLKDNVIMYVSRFFIVALLGWAGAGLWVSELAHIMWLFDASLVLVVLAVVAIIVESVRHGF